MRGARHWFLVLALVAAVLLSPMGAGADNVDLEQIGQPVNPAYIHPREVANFPGVALRKPTNLQTRRPGGANQTPFRLDRAKTYLWLVSADGTTHVAPVKKLADGSETTGHPMLNGGQPARLGGELFFRDGKWVMNNDSGRYSHFNTSVRRKGLTAARRLFDQIGLQDRDGAKIRVTEKFIIPWGQRKGDPLNQRNARKAASIQRLGGYVLKVDKKSDNPQTLKERMAWSRAARATLPTKSNPSAIRTWFRVPARKQALVRATQRRSAMPVRNIAKPRQAKRSALRSRRGR